MQTVVPSTGAGVQALLITVAISFELSIKEPPWYTRGKVPVTRTKTTIGSTDTRNRHTLPIDPYMQMLYTTCLLAFQTSTRVLVLRVPVYLVLLFAFASLSS